MGPLALPMPRRHSAPVILGMAAVVTLCTVAGGQNSGAGAVVPPSEAGDAASARVTELISDLQSADVGVRISAIDELANSSDRRGIAALVDVCGDTDSAVRAAAARALGTSGDRSRSPIVRALIADPDPHVAAAAVRAAGRLGDRKALPAARNLVRSENPSVRTAVADALPGIADQDGLPLLDQLAADDIPEVRRSVALALGELGDAGAEHGLLALLGDSDAGVCDAAAWALLKQPRVPLAEIARLATDGSPASRAAATRALGRVGHPSTAPVIQKALSDEDPAARKEAAQALGAMRAIGAAETIAPLLGDRVAIVRSAGASALAALGPTGVRQLEAALESHDASARAAALSGLGRSGGSAELIAQYLADPAPECRAAAANALERMGGPASKVAARALASNDDNVAAAGARILAAASPTSLDALGEALRSGRPRLAQAAAEGLAGVEAAGAGRILSEAVASGGAVGGHAARVAGARRDPVLVPALVSALDRPDTAEAAARALGWVGDVSAIDALVETLESDTPASGAAAEALAQLGPAGHDVLVAELSNETVRPLALGALSLTPVGEPHVADLINSASSVEKAFIARGMARGGAPDADDVLRTLLGDGDPRVRLAAAGSQRSTRGDSVVDKAYLDALRQELATGEPAERQKAATLLGALGDSDSVPVLVSLLRDEATEVRTAAKNALSEMADTSIPVAAGLLREHDAALVADGAGILEAIGTDAAERVLLAALPSASDEALLSIATALAGNTSSQVRVAQDRAANLLLGRAEGGDVSAIQALGELGEVGTDRLRRLAQQGTPEQRVRSLVALRRRAREDLADAAARALTFAQGPLVLTQAAEAAGRAGAPDTARHLASLLQSEDPVVVGAAARALGALRSDDAASALGDLLPNADTGPAAARALGLLGTSGHRLLLGTLAGDDSVAATSAALGLGLAASEEATASLVQALAADDPNLRAAAARALSESGADVVGAVGHVAARTPATAEDARQRGAAIAVLGRVGTPGSAQVISELPDAPDVRSRQASALAKMGAAGGEHLEQMLTQGGASRLWALRQADGPLPSGMARRALQSDDAATRQAAGAALSRYPLPSTYADLAAALDDDDAKVRWAAAEALGAAGEFASPDMVGKLTSGSDAARAAIADVLGLTGGQAAEDALTAALADSSPTVVGRSLTSLGRIAPALASREVNRRLGALGDAPSGAALRALDELRAAASVARASVATALAANPESWLLLAIVADEPSETEVDVLASATAAGSEVVALAAVRALRGQTLPSAVAALENAARRGPIDVAGAALSALEEMGQAPKTAAEARDRLLSIAAGGAPRERARALYGLRDVGGDAVTAAFVEALGDGNTEVREAATSALVARRDTSIGVLAPALRGPDTHERRAAVRALGAMGDADARETLVQLAGDSSDTTQADAIWALQRIPGASSSATVLDFANSALADEGAAASVLAAIGPGATGVLDGALDAPDARTRARSAALLGSMGAVTLADRLATLLQTDESPLVRLHVTRALERLGPNAARDALVKALDDPDPGVAAEAATALGRLKLGDVPALPVERLAASPQTAAAAGIALARLGGPSAAGDLAESPNVPARVAAALGLSQSDPSDVAALLGDPDAMVRLAASRALADIGPSALPALRAAASSGDLSRARAAVVAAGHIPGDGALELLRHAAERRELRADAIVALARRDTDAGPALPGLLQSADPGVRRAAALALASSPDAVAASALLAALQDSDPSVVRAAVQAGGAAELGSIVLSQLLPLLTRDDTGPAAAQLLSKQASAAPLLADDLADPDLNESVIGILGEMGTDEAVSVLLPLMEGDDAAAADLAAVALAGVDDDTARDAVRRYGDRLCTRLSAADPADRPDIASTLVLVSPEAAADHLAVADDDVAGHLLGVLSQRQWTGDPGAVLRLLESDDPRVQHLASLALVNGPSGPDVLIPLVRRPNPKVSAAAARALVSTGDAAALEAVTQRAQEVAGGLSNDDPLARENAVAVLAAMGEIGVAAATPRLAAGGVTATSAMRVLAQAGGSEAVAGIVALLAERAPSTRAEAAWSLGQFGSAEAAEALVRTLGDPQSDVVLAAAEALRALTDGRGTEGAIEAAADALDDRARHGDPRTCRRLTRALAMLGNPGSAALVRLALDDEVHPDTRRAALLAVRLEQPGQVQEIAGLLNDDRLGPAAAEALANASGASGAADALESALASNNPQVVLAAARAAGRLGDGRLLPALSAALRRAGQPEAGTLAWALARGGAAAENSLEALLRSVRSPDARASVVAALGAIGSPAAVEALTAALAEEDVRQQAIQALGRIASAEALDVLVGLLGAEDELSPRTAAGALSRAGETAVPRLRAAARDGSSTQRYWAVLALSRIDSPASRAVLDEIAGLHDPATDWLIREITAPGP